MKLISSNCYKGLNLQRIEGSQMESDCISLLLLLLLLLFICLYVIIISDYFEDLAEL